MCNFVLDMISNPLFLFICNTDVIHIFVDFLNSQHHVKDAAAVLLDWIAGNYHVSRVQTQNSYRLDNIFWIEV